jgi:transposase-like protein
MRRRKIDPETKMVAVLEGLRGERSVADICRKYQISESLYYRWRDKSLEGGSQALRHMARQNKTGPCSQVRLALTPRLSRHNRCLIPHCGLCESRLTCHSEGAKRPKNLITTTKHESLRCTQDDKMALRSGFKLRSYQ